MITLDTLLFKEEVQIKGLSYIFECSNLTLGHTTMWTPSSASEVFKHCEKSLPIRRKKISVINLPRPLLFVLEFAKLLVSPKMKSRIFLNEKIEDFPNVPKTQWDEITKSWISEIEAQKSNLESLDQIKIVKKSKEPEKSIFPFWR